MSKTDSTILWVIAFYAVWGLCTVGSFFLYWRGQMTTGPLLATIVFGSTSLTLVIALIIVFAWEVRL